MGAQISELYYNLGFEYYLVGKFEESLSNLELANASSKSFGELLQQLDRLL